MPRRYLWAVGAAELPADQVLSDRYQGVAAQIFLDTKPGILPTQPTDVPSNCATYLRLSPYRFHVPQIYAILNPEQTGLKQRILLLDQAAIAIPSHAQATAQLLPSLQQSWPTVTGMRQLSWFRQLLTLWAPLDKEQVTATLLTPALLRVDGSTVRLAELRANATLQATVPPSLGHLGERVATWASTAHPEVRSTLTTLCQQIIQGQLKTPEQAIAAVDAQLARLGRSQTRSLQLATLTDQGPTRERNEDACFPDSGTLQRHALTPTAGAELPLAIVCDGIGGHEGGNVASMLAIQTIRDRLTTFFKTAKTAATPLDFAVLTTELELAVCAANDAISDRNDQEQRQDRQRMGTTVVMALGRSHELYITNLGDSRAYRITRQGCRQITLDDDVATREVRLGYLLYREAVKQPGSGSLVQALGMGPSSYLYPSVYHFVTDEDCLVVLCSDGLSDNDLVDLVWESELLPVLDGQRDLATASRRLVEIANRSNGYDNVTVGLVHCQVQDPAWATINTTLTPRGAVATTLPPDFGVTLGGDRSPEPPSPPLNSSPTEEPDPLLPKTVNLTSPAAATTTRGAKPWLSLLSLALVLGLLGLLGWGLYVSVPPVRDRLNAWFGTPTTPTPETDVPPPPNPNDPPAIAPPTTLSVQTLVRVRAGSATTSSTASAPLDSLVLLANLEFLPTPNTPPAAPVIVGIVPAGSLLKVEQVQQSITQGDRWLKVLVCELAAPTVTPAPGSPSAGAAAPPAPPAPPPLPPTATTPTPTPLGLGAQGWVLETELLTFAEAVSGLDPNTCPAPASPPPTVP